MIIINAREEAGQVILRTRAEAIRLIESFWASDAENKPGAWIKRYGHRFPEMKNFTAEDFNHPHFVKRMLRK